MSAQLDGVRGDDGVMAELAKIEQAAPRYGTSLYRILEEAATIELWLQDGGDDGGISATSEPKNLLLRLAGLAG